VSGVLIPGTDVVWLEVPYSALPGERKNVDTTLSNGKNYGFQMNAMRIVANKKFTDANPAAAELFAIMKLNINDVSAQNGMMAKGANTPKDINAHADGWIKAHQTQFDAWIEAAKKAAM
jgi:glycine betaine/proline transport system substrate-binding protein